MSRTLLVDLGNSCLKWAFHSEGPLQPQSVNYADDTLAQLCERLWATEAPPEKILVSCVTGETGQFADWCRGRWDRQPVFARSAPRFGSLRNGYRQPQQLGVDRWLALIAGHARHPGEAFAVLDLGTAATLDLVVADGQHLGGYIMPGLGSMQACLQRQTGLAEPVTMAAPLADGFGRDTDSAIQLGSRAALLGMLQQGLAQFQRMTGEVPRLLITGGDARQLMPELDRPCEWHPALVLEGLLRTVEES